MKKSDIIITFAVIWLLIVTALYCIPGTKFPKISWSDKFLLDKWIHFFLFLVLVILWSKSYSLKKSPTRNLRKAFFQIMILGFLYGILMEMMQKYFIPYRSFDLADIMANGLGCVAGYFFALKKFLPATS